MLFDLRDATGASKTRGHVAVEQGLGGGGVVVYGVVWCCGVVVIW